MIQIVRKYHQFIKSALLVTAVCAVCAFAGSDFKRDQMKYGRVKTAYKKWDKLRETLKQKGIEGNFEIHLRHFKLDKQLELWAKNKGDKNFSLVRTFAVCAGSGVPGPKRHEGDYQVPEGFYTISWFNPMSDYHLALKVSYPNPSDLIKSKGKRPGGDIMIHGNCVTIGCIPLQNDPVEDLYVYCVESKNYGNTIQLSMYPCRFTASNETLLKAEAKEENTKLWESLKKAYNFFEKNKYPAPYTIAKNGDYIIHE